MLAVWIDDACVSTAVTCSTMLIFRSEISTSSKLWPVSGITEVGDCMAKVTVDGKQVERPRKKVRPNQRSINQKEILEIPVQSALRHCPCDPDFTHHHNTETIVKVKPRLLSHSNRPRPRSYCFPCFTDDTE
jgi:hypothetical protein